MRSAHSVPRERKDRQRPSWFFPVLRSNDFIAKEDDVAHLVDTYRSAHESTQAKAMAEWQELRRRNPDVPVNDLHHAVAEVSRERALRRVAEVAHEMANATLRPKRDTEAVLRGDR